MERLFDDLDHGWLALGILLSRVIVDLEVPISAEPDRISDDFCAEGESGVVSLQRDVRGDGNDRAGELAAGVPADRQRAAVAIRQIDEQTLVGAAGRRAEDVSRVTIPGHVAGGHIERDTGTVAGAVAVKAHAGTAVAMHEQVAAIERAIGSDLKLTARDQ